jgi:hypothetical protein
MLYGRTSLKIKKLAESYEALESRGVKYATRIPANENRERDVVELLLRPAGRPSHKLIVWYKSFLKGYS